MSGRSSAASETENTVEKVVSSEASAPVAAAARIDPVVTPEPDSDPVEVAAAGQTSDIRAALTRPGPQTPKTVDSAGSTPPTPPVLEVNGPVTPPTAPAQEVQVSENAVEATDLGSGFKGAAIAGRVKTFDLNDSTISGIEVLKGPAYGNVTVNPDNTLAVVLTGTTQTSDIRFDIRVTYDNGSVQDETVAIDVTPGSQADGWGTGQFYMLETDENDDIIVEHGENHRKVHVSGDQDALTLADIAALEGLSVKDITGGWLAAHPEYGADPEMALAQDAGAALWGTITGREAEPSSNWLLFERGYTYDEMGNVLQRETMGESELHPIYLGAYGEGTDPEIANTIEMMRIGNGNIVMQGLHLTGGVDFLRGENVLLDNMKVTEEELNIQNIEGFTIRNSDIYDVIRHQTRDGDPEWDPLPDRISGIYAANVNGLLINGVFVDHSGWGEGYDPGMSADDPQVPSKYSHNFYLQSSNRDVTVSDSIIMRAAGTGLQIRSGGVVENNIFIDNNGAVFAGSGSDGGGNYTLFLDNTVTSGAHKTADEGVSALTAGLTNQGKMSTLVDNIVTHLADPNNLSELDYKLTAHDGLKHAKEVVPLYDDTIVYNWVGAGLYEKDPDINNANLGALDTDVLDETTIQIFAAELLGKKTATIADLANYLRGEADGRFEDVVDADMINAFFKAGFGLDTTLRTTAETLRFVPNELADGVRWDNKLNWDSGDLPGTQTGDSVALAGNWVQYSGTTRLEDMDLGEGGKLFVNQGYLEVQDHLSVGDTGGTLSIDRAGQFWTNGYTDQDLLTLDVAGGRFANTGTFVGTTEMTVSDNAQALLATENASFGLNDDSRLEIVGANAKVGFDGETGGTGVLHLGDTAELAFTAADGKLGSITEFYSGRYESSDIESGINLGNAELFIDVTGMTTTSASSWTLMETDEIVGTFDTMTVQGTSAKQDVSLIIDYGKDTVTFNLGADGQGSGKSTIYTVGDETASNSSKALWEALTNGHGIYSDDDPVSIPEEEDDDPLDIAI